MVTPNNRVISADGSETFKVTITGTAEGDTVSLTLLENGVTYDVIGSNGAGGDTAGVSISLDGELDFGTRSY